MIVRLGRWPNGIVRAPGPVVVASTTRQTPWSDSRDDCAAVPWLPTNPMLSAASNSLFTIRLLDAECRAGGPPRSGRSDVLGQGYWAVMVMQALLNSVAGAASLSTSRYITSFVVPARIMSVRNSKSRAPLPSAAVVRVMSGPVLGSGIVWNASAAASLGDHGKRLRER